MGIQGRLTKERFGASMPVHAPHYQALPVHYRGSKAALFQYVTDGDAAADLLPAPLELIDPPTAALALLEFPWTTVGAYNEAIQLLLCTYHGRLMQYVVHIFVTNDAAMVYGREAFGIPKKMAHIEFVQENEIRAAYVERPRGLRICSAVIRPEQPVEPSTVQAWPPLVAVRLIPGVGGPPTAELIEEKGTGIKLKELWTGTGSCHFPSGSALDPWHSLPVRQMVACLYAVADSELGQGQVLERLL